MKQFSLDFRNFKKMSEDDRCATLMHPNGHEIKVAKNALSEGMKRQLESLELHKSDNSEAMPESQQQPVQHLNQGGTVGDWMRSQPQQAPMQIDLGMPQRPSMPVPQTREEAQAMDNRDGMAFLNGLVNPSSGASQPEAQAAAPSNFQLAPQQAQAPMGMPAMGQGNASTGQMQRGIQAEADAMSAQGNAEVAAVQQHQQQLTDLDLATQSEMAALQARRQALTDDIAAGHINPDAFIDSRSGGQKIGMAIGLLLGGIGEGLNGKPNAALQRLTKRIDQDIDAQKTELGKKRSLLEANTQDLGDMRAGVAMSKAMLADRYSAQIMEAAARSKDPLAQARALQITGQLKAQSEATLAGVGQQRAMSALVASGQMSPARAVAYLPKEHQGKALEEIKKYEEMQSSLKNLEASMQEMSAEQTLGNRVGSPIQSSRRIGALETNITAALKPIFGALSESDKKQVESNKIGLLDDAQTKARKTKVILDIVRANSGAGSTPTLEMHGIRLPKSASESGFTPIQGLPPNRK